MQPLGLREGESIIEEMGTVVCFREEKVKCQAVATC